MNSGPEEGGKRGLRMEPDAIRGIWIPVEAILEGKKLPEEGLEGMVLTIDRSTYSIRAQSGLDRGTIALDRAVAQ